VYTFGWHKYGQLGQGDFDPSSHNPSLPHPVIVDPCVVQVACGHSHTFVLHVSSPGDGFLHLSPDSFMLALDKADDVA
jgi:alpha-tubulin suppressor-like RCC1 family protein